MDKRPYVAEDLLKMRWVGSPSLSPCGKRVAFVVSEILEEENTYASALWLYDSTLPASSSIRQISYHGGSHKGRDANPKWPPSGRMIAFLSDRVGSVPGAGAGSQIFVLDMGGGEARQVTDMPKGVADFDWLDDEALVFSAKEDVDSPNLREGATARRITNLRYKFNGVGYLDGLKTQLWSVSLNEICAASIACDQGSERGFGQKCGQGREQSDKHDSESNLMPDSGQRSDSYREPKRLTSGPYDCGAPVASPTGKYVAFVSNRSGDEQALFSDLYVLETETDRLIKVTASIGHVGSPVFAPDGSTVYYIGHEKGQSYPGAYPEIWKVDLTTLERKVISGKFPHLIGGGIGGDVGPDSGKSGLSISVCGKYLYFVAVDGGSSYLYRLAVESGDWEKAYGEGQMVVKSYDVGSGKVVVNKSTPVSMGDLWYGEIDGGKPGIDSGVACDSDSLCEGSTRTTGTNTVDPSRMGDGVAAFSTSSEMESGMKQITDFNCELTAEKYTGWPEPMTFDRPDGTRLEGWVILPRGYEKGKKYPLVMEIHGGPHTTYGNVFFHEFQMLAGAGFGVLYTNPRGSMGYGEKFARVVVGDWCGIDAWDLEMMAEEALRVLDWVDLRRFGVTGGSQGGYFTNWLIGHTNLFAAAVTQRSMSNLYSKYGVSDIGWSGDRAGMGGKDLWEHEDFIMERSPIRYARNVKTPTLIIHSDQDYRCPLEQGEQWYVALKRLGVETEMLLFHGENHELSRSGKPANRIVRLEAILEWFERFMGTER